MSTKKTLIAGLGIVVVGLLGFYVAHNFYLKPSSLSQNTQTPGIDSKMASGLPVQLTIPSINVNAPIIDVALAKDGSVGVPSGPDQVAWYQLGPRPGDKGSAVITGHFGPWKNGESSVFDNLNKVKPGDHLYVKDDTGKSTTFIVTAIHTYAPNESVPEVFNKTDGAYLNLITCHGDWLAAQKTYTQRLVVFTKAAV